MSVNPDMSANMGVADEYVDLEHQVIRQKVDFFADESTSGEVGPGNSFAEFDPGERQLDREEVAQLVYYRRYATLNWLQVGGDADAGADFFAIVDASVGINGDLFREVTTASTGLIDDDDIQVDTGGEIGLLDNYQLFAQPIFGGGPTGEAGGGVKSITEHSVDYYDWPTGGPIVDSFDTITCGFAYGANSGSGTAVEGQFELRYDFYWDVAEQGRSTNPFGRPSTR